MIWKDCKLLFSFIDVHCRSKEVDRKISEIIEPFDQDQKYPEEIIFKIKPWSSFSSPFYFCAYFTLTTRQIFRTIPTCIDKPKTIRKSFKQGDPK